MFRLLKFSFCSEATDGKDDSSITDQIQCDAPTPLYACLLWNCSDGQQPATQRACVTGAGAGVDSAWDQENSKSEICSKTSQNPQSPVHAVLDSA
jgi:hypothetical protein